MLYAYKFFSVFLSINHLITGHVSNFIYTVKCCEENVRFTIFVLSGCLYKGTVSNYILQH
jgi:hypothetical protein